MEDSKKVKIKLRDVLVSLLTALLFSVFLPVFVYTNNIEEASFSGVLPVMLIFAGIGAAIFGVFFLCFRKNIFLVTACSVLTILSLSNYALIEKLVSLVFPNVKFWSVIVDIVFFLVVFIFIVNKYTDNKIKEMIPPVLLIVVSVLLVINVVVALPAGIKKLTASVGNGNDITEDMPTVSGERMPNVYYLIFDEFSNTEIMKKYYDYDNSGFDRRLEEKGFTVSQNTQNGSVFSTVILTNYMNYEYLVCYETSEEERVQLRQNSRLKKLFDSQGYEIIGVGGSDGIGVPSVTQFKKYEASTMDGKSISSIILSNTVYAGFVDDTNRKLANEVIDGINYFSRENIEKNNGGNVFTLSYICSPHAPFMFDENGNETDPANYINYEDKQYYLGQYIYISKMIEQVVDNIIEYDKDCVIIIQADHAIRDVPGITPEDRKKPFNAVYYRGEDISEIKGQSGVNTLRIVLNRLFDMDLEMLEVDESGQYE